MASFVDRLKQLIHEIHPHLLLEKGRGTSAGDSGT